MYLRGLNWKGQGDAFRNEAMKHNQIRNHWRGFEAWTSGYKKRHDRLWVTEVIKAKKARRWNEHMETKAMAWAWATGELFKPSELKGQGRCIPD